MSEQPLNTVDANNSNGSTADELIRQSEFGVFLREARQASGLTIQDVSDRLKLHEDIIKALENSRVDALPAAAFTQGYIKAYAKLLKISPDEIMRAYDVMVPVKAATLNVTSGIPAERSSRDGAVRVTSYVLVALGFILLVFWVRQTGFELPGNYLQTDIMTDPVEEDQAQSEAYPADVVSEESLVMMDAISAGESDAAAQPVRTNTGNAAGIEKNAIDPVAVAKKPEIKPEIRPAQNTVAVASRGESTVPAKPEQKLPLPVNGDDVIRLSSSADSWGEVQDADNNRLFYSLMKAGDSYAIKGRAPFRIFLGNAPSVTVEVNNQTVDISRYIRQNNIAHVKISAKAAAQSGGARQTINQVTDQFIPETPVTGKTE